MWKSGITRNVMAARRCKEMEPVQHKESAFVPSSVAVVDKSVGMSSHLTLILFFEKQKKVNSDT